MAPTTNETVVNEKALNSTNPNGAASNLLNIESLLLRDEDAFTTSLNSDDYLESLAPIIKDALKVNGLSSLIHRLNEIVKEKDEELNELSLSSAEDISSCMNSIDTIYDESGTLNKSLTQISQFLHKCTYELINKKKTLTKNKEVNTKINETSMALGLCIQVLEITSKIHELIKQKRYFSALKLIDELTNVHLLKVENFNFAAKIYESIPHLTRMIRDESFENLTKWLAINVERKLSTVGEKLFDNLYELQTRWEQTRKGPLRAFFGHQRLNSPIEISMRDPSLNYKIFSDPTLQLDASTLFDAILVYQTLGEDESLSKMYNREWLKKYNRVIYPITFSVNSLSESSLHDTTTHFNDILSLQQYLKRICAFFAMDKQLNLLTKFQVRSNTSSNDLWDSYAAKLKPELLNYLKCHKLNLDDVTTFKDLVGNFLQIMTNNGYKTHELYKILIIILKDYFAPELMIQFRSEFIDSIQSDHYMPLVIHDKRDYDNIMKVCWYKPDASFAPQNVHSMPISFPFSEDYVHYCLGIRSLLEDVIQFIGVHYSYDKNEVNRIIVDIFEKILGEEKGVGIINDIKEFVSKNSNNKEIVAQTYTNLEFYLYSIYELGKIINRRLKSTNGMGVHSTDAQGAFTLQSIKNLTAVRKFSEETIFHMVDNKVKELLDMLEYHDWLPTVRNTEANYSVKDFALFLENLFTSIFSNLPLTFRTLGLFRSYDFIAEHLINTLKNAEVYNRIAIDNFDLDVTYLEDSMRKLSLEGKENGQKEEGAVSLQSTFIELRQCIDLLKLDNYEEFTKNPALRMRKFDRIKLEDGIRLISKVYSPEAEADANIHLDDSVPSSNSSDLQNPSLLTSSASIKFAKFSSKFKKPSNIN